MFTFSKYSLESLAGILEQLTATAYYAQPCDALSDSSIGQHTRHIIELYQCLISGYQTGVISYDNRNRNKVLENDANEAIRAIREIQAALEAPDKELTLILEIGPNQVTINSNYYREVLYNMEHCIHHQALIKVACLSFNIKVSEQFGVAPSTTKYRLGQTSSVN